jgi:hypothetical protein
VPDPQRNPKYFETADNVAIRDAVTALVELVLPVGRLYFGGHPAITPMVRVSAQRLHLLDNVRNYQSTWYQKFFPPDNAAFRHLIFVPAERTQQESERAMRVAMLNAEPLAAAFFIGGMEGIETEYQMVRDLSPRPACYPVGSTGGASLILLRDRARELGLAKVELDALMRETDYLPLFRQLLQRSGVVSREG